MGSWPVNPASQVLLLKPPFERYVNPVRALKAPGKCFGVISKGGLLLYEGLLERIYSYDAGNYRDKKEVG
jgi:hypothetical protein